MYNTSTFFYPEQMERMFPFSLGERLHAACLVSGERERGGVLGRRKSVAGTNCLFVGIGSTPFPQANLT